jgi:hypothetical protein
LLIIVAPVGACFYGAPTVCFVLYITSATFFAACCKWKGTSTLSLKTVHRTVFTAIGGTVAFESLLSLAGKIKTRHSV